MSTLEQRILLIRTGGTIDAEAYPDPSNPPKYVDTLSAEKSLVMNTVAALPNGDLVDGFDWGYAHAEQFVKDSQHFTEQDMNELADIIKHDSRRQFIITHGTDAMAKNASVLQQALQGTDKTVVFVGAMVPLSMSAIHTSDGVAALKYAVDSMHSLSAGVYLTARDSHTQRLGFFNPAQVEKNRPLSKESLAFTVN